MGKNFAQMEMRVILAHLFHKVRTETRLYARERMRKSGRESVEEIEASERDEQNRHTHVCTHLHTLTHTYTHTLTHTYTPAHTHTHTQFTFTLAHPTAGFDEENFLGINRGTQKSVEEPLLSCSIICSITCFI